MNVPAHSLARNVRRRMRLGGWAVIALWISLTAGAEVLKGPYVLLEDATVLRIRFEVDRPDYAVTLIHDSAEHSIISTAYSRSPRDTFLGDVLVKLTAERPLRGYRIGRPGEPAKSYDWRSRIDGRLSGYPKLLVFGDSQGGSATLKRLGEQWRKEEFDLVVGLGDLADAGSRYESWNEEFFEPLRELLPHYPFLAICGNHDSYREKSLAWFDWYFGRGDGRRYFRIDFGDLRLIALNNSDLHTKYGFDPIDPLTPQYDFLLESALGATARDKKIAVFCHVPIVSGSTVVNREFGSVLQQKYILPILEGARVIGFFAGHHHKFERVVLPRIHGAFHHIVTGGGGGRLFTAARERGGFAMDREVFETHHYLTVDFAGEGSVVARALGGAEIDRVSFSPHMQPGGTAGRLVFWRADVGADLSLTPTARAGDTLDVGGSPPAEAGPGATGEIFRTERGLVGLARDLSTTSAEHVSFQGYDSQRKTWGYLQGASLVLPVQGIYGALALISLSGADLFPLDGAFPVLHWPLAGVRAGLDEKAGAAMLLRDGRDFELEPDPRRLIAKWRWGEPGLGPLAEEQRLRQWRLMDAPPLARRPSPLTIAELIQLVLREGRPEGFVLREGDAEPVAALLYWRRWQFLTVITGKNLAVAPGSLFAGTAAETRIAASVVDGVPGLRITQGNAESLFVKLSGRRERR